MRVAKSVLAGAVLALIVAVGLWTTPVGAQAIARIYGTYNGNPIALLANSSGLLRVSLEGGAVTSSIIPATDNTIDLGDATHRWRTGYFVNLIASLFTQPASSSTSAGSATTTDTIVKSVTGIANATNTTVFTLTIPNAAHAAAVSVVFTCSLGAGGAIGANEATGTIGYQYGVTRTAGLDTVLSGSSAFGSGNASVTGAATITISNVAAVITGLSSATQTATIPVIVSRGSGSSTNHSCVARATLTNFNASGVTIQ